MPKASDYIPEQRLFAMFVGRSGDGKSVAAAGFPRPYHQLDFDFRFGGVAAAIKQGLITSEDITYQQFLPRGGWDPVDKHLMQFENDRITGNFKLKTLEVASVGSLARLLVVSSHKLQGGKMMGSLRISGPGDYNMESNGTHQVFDYLRSWPCNIICSAHMVDKYGKLDKSKEYSESGVIGEKLAVRDNLGENILTYFDNVFRFSRDLEGNQIKFYVEFATDLAKNTFGIPPGRFDITNKNFYIVFQELVKKYQK